MLPQESKKSDMTDFNAAVQSKSNNDLLKMIYEIDQWSPKMLTAVEKELLKRGILPTDVGESRQKIIDAEIIGLSKGRKASLAGQVVGWVCVFGLFGIFMGYHYGFSKVRSRYTDKVYFKYNEDSRKNGKYLFCASILLSAITILYQF